MTEPEERTIVFRLNDHGQGPELLRQVFLEKGWQEFEEEEQEEHDWNLWWRSSRFRVSDYENVMPWQRLNHHPKSQAITKKDSLARNLKRMRGVHGPNVYNFSPLAFNLPNDYTRFVAEYARLKEKNPHKDLYWICKPADLSRGRGISIFKDIAELQYDCNAVVQQYLMNPLLISGYKFDLRIYVVVPSFNPLHVYIYEEGLVRFSTEKYDLGCLSNLYSHLTNTSINKYSPSYTLDKERVGPGCKWTLTQLRHYFHQVNIDDQTLWLKIINIVTLTILIQASQAPKATNCFELFGFDIIIDENLKPWLLEVNFGPALGCDCQVDISVKKPMLHDLLDMLNFIEEDKDRGGQNFHPAHHRSLGHYRGAMLTSRSFHMDGRKSRANNSRKSGVGKLPDIMLSSTHSFVSQTTQSSNIAEQDSEDCEVVPIIPGCGLPSVQQPVKRCTSSGRSSAGSSIHSLDNDKAAVKRAPARAARVIRRKDSRGKMRQTRRYPKKMESKASMYSDSAVSSYSGSSDNSDRSLLVTETDCSCIAEDKTTESLRKVSLSDPTVHHPYTRRSLSPRQRTTRTVPSKTSSQQGQPDEGIDVSTPTMLKPKRPTHMSFPANPIVTKSALVTRSHHGGLKHGHSISHRASQQPRAKLWHNTKPPGTDTSPKNSTKHLNERFGGLIKVFPFNDATRRCSHNPDAKVVIRECQKWLRSMTSKDSDHSKREVALDTPPLWRPLREQSQS